MPDYMIIILENETERQRRPPAEMNALIEGHAAYVDELKAAGAYRDGERFRPSSEGRRVGGTSVGAGPFGEGLAMAAYYLVNAANLEEAVALAQRSPMSPGDTHDVRPVMKAHLREDKAHQKGKVFGFAVLGNATTEQAWVELMDRIDHDTHDGFPDDRFLGGLRLEAPTRGRHIQLRGDKRTVMDGPFLESKEVIGGVFFMRMTDLDEAVLWARTTRFMKHGALEIRELWRT